jgi:hypothetical protein
MIASNGWFINMELFLWLGNQHTAYIHGALVTINRRFVAVAVQLVFFESASVACRVFDWCVVAITPSWSVTNQAVDAAKTRHFKILDEVVATSAAVLACECIQLRVAAMAALNVFKRILGFQPIVLLVFEELLVLFERIRGMVHLVERKHLVGFGVNVNHAVELECGFVAVSLSWVTCSTSACCVFAGCIIDVVETHCMKFVGWVFVSSL